MNIIDFSHSLGPFGLLEIINRFKQLKPGQMLEIVGMDDVNADDLQRILPDSGFEAIATSDGQGRVAGLCVRLSKRGGRPASST